MQHTSVYITRHKASNRLEIRSTPIPEPEPGKIRIKVLTAGVSFAEVLMKAGLYPGMKPPFVPGYDLVGIVDKLGKGVVDIRPGETVAVLTNGQGAYSEYYCAAPEELIPVPDGIDAAEAVSLILNYLTAYQMLHRTARISLGKRVLIHNAAGGVGSALMQLGRLAGLKL